MIDWGLVLSVVIAIMAAKVGHKIGIRLWGWFSDVVWRIIS